MKNKTQYIAVFVGIALVGFLLYGNSFMNLFNGNTNNTASTSQGLPETGVEVQDEIIGEGAVAQTGDKVTVHYVGRLTDGKVFDSSVDRGEPFVFSLGAGQVIKGWDEGLVGMKEGGKRILIIAPDYGYGSQGVGPIPPNSTLIFEVQLIKTESPAVTN